MVTSDKAILWNKITEKYGLQQFEYDRLVNWNFADFVWHNDVDVMSSTMKCRKYGFFEFQDTEEMLFNIFSMMKEKKIIP